MELRDYQTAAQATDQVTGDDANATIVPLLGMAGEVGSLLGEYKKWLRDGDAHQLFPEQLSEELGDILWYLANTASKFGLDLATIAEVNLAKTRDQWPPPGEEPPYQLLDAGYPPHEQLPRRFTAEIIEDAPDDDGSRITLTIDDEPAGSQLRDNAYDDDGYRFHDVLHLAHAAKLGWSPVLRGVLLRPARKRKSRAEVDEIEDGGRAIVIDEAIVAYVFDYARRHQFLAGIDSLDYRLLKTIKSLTSSIEVAARSSAQWQEAILAGYEVWRSVRRQRGGRIEVDLETRNIQLVS